MDTCVCHVVLKQIPFEEQRCNSVHCFNDERYEKDGGKKEETR
jgi:hypothetical protein